MRTNEYLLSIRFDIDENKNIPIELLNSISEPDILVEMLSNLAKNEEFASELLRVNAELYGPEPSYL